MKEITIISGKGGTGKTSLAGSFAALAGGKAVTSDCDVDAANLALIMQPELQESHLFQASCKASIDKSRCSECGICRDLCRFEAITPEFQVNSLKCEGCGVCYHACPEEAIDYAEVVSGKWFISTTPYGPLVHARLGVAEENSGKLVTLLRQKAKEIAGRDDKQIIINDGPPGIGCPVIASLGGADLAVIVTEPTLSGIHDLERITSVCRHFNVPSLICINRADLDQENTHRITNYCRENSIPLAGLIPFHKVFTEAVVNKTPVVEYGEGTVQQSIQEVWERINYEVGV